MVVALKKSNNAVGTPALFQNSHEKQGKARGRLAGCVGTGAVDGDGISRTAGAQDLKYTAQHFAESACSSCSSCTFSNDCCSMVGLV